MVKFVIKDMSKNMEIKMDENILFRLYCIYKEIELEGNLELKNIIKVMLPDDEEKALKTLNEGLVVEDKLFLPLLTSPSLQKNEDKELGKCSYMFIAEEDTEFIELFEKLISLDKLRKFNGKEICIAKDVTARTGLALSSSTFINYKPNIVVLPEIKYNYTANYFKLNGIELKANQETLEHTAYDGCGFMSPKMAKIIQKELNLDYEVDFAQFRLYNGIAAKGIVVKADFQKFFEEFEYMADKNYFWKDKKGDFITKDVFGKEVNISKADLILNKTQVKWLKLWKDEVKEFGSLNKAIEEEISKDIYSPYRKTLEGIYISRVNKKEIKEYSLTNYQLICNLALTQKDIEQLAKETLNSYKRVVGRGENGEKDIDAIRLFLKDIARDEQEELSASTKVTRLLQIDERFSSTYCVEDVVNNMISKSAHQLAAGKFLVEGNYKTGMGDPIAYLKWILTRKFEGNRELGVNEFYVAGKEGQRVSSRNPLASFSEVHKIKLVKTDLLDKYFGNHTKELLFINMKDDFLMTSSGADLDGDIFFIINNNTIFNSVIDPKDGINFLNENDGDKKELLYTRENMYEAVVKSSGNFIGSVANTSTLISNFCQRLEYFVYEVKEDGKKHKISKTYMDIKEAWREKFKKEENCKVEKHYKLREYLLKSDKLSDKMNLIRNNDNKKDEFKKLQEEFFELNKKIGEVFESYLEHEIKRGKFIDVASFNEEEIREHIKMRFYRFMNYSYYTLKISQVAIDAQKTLVTPTKEDMKIVDDFLERNEVKKYPIFMYYAKYSKNYENKNRIDYNQCSKLRDTALNKFAKKVQSELITPINDYHKGTDNSKSRLYRILKDIAVENNKCYEEFFEFYKIYQAERQKISREYEKDKKEKNRRLSFLDIYAIQREKELEEKYTTEELAYAIIKTECSSKFIIDIMFNTLEKAITSKTRECTIYKEDENGDINFLFKRYSKHTGVLAADCKTQDKNYKLKVKQVSQKARIQYTDKDKMADEVLIKIEEYKGNEQLILTNKEGEKIGFFYRDQDLSALKKTEGILKVLDRIDANKSATLFLL
ncbi:TPA: RNA-dependent RNA polymerase [Clostridium perfringens]